MYEEEGVAAPVENVPEWAGIPSGNGSSVRGVNERVEEMDVAPEQSRVRREDPEIEGGRPTEAVQIRGGGVRGQCTSSGRGGRADGKQRGGRGGDS